MASFYDINFCETLSLIFFLIMTLSFDKKLLGCLFCFVLKTSSTVSFFKKQQRGGSCNWSHKSHTKRTISNQSARPHVSPILMHNWGQRRGDSATVTRSNFKLLVSKPRGWTDTNILQHAYPTASLSKGPKATAAKPFSQLFKLRKWKTKFNILIKRRKCPAS